MQKLGTETGMFVVVKHPCGRDQGGYEGEDSKGGAHVFFSEKFSTLWDTSSSIRQITKHFGRTNADSQQGVVEHTGAKTCPGASIATTWSSKSTAFSALALTVGRGVGLRWTGWETNMLRTLLRFTR